tara:strand:+ start:327 stop:1139 length:813 start_codon:yes stop_codon:yes gene_type:complete
MKHNKKRNTAFIFEVLIRELTKSIVEKDDKKKKIIISLIKENFKNKTALARDLELYKALLDTQDVEKDVAEKLIFECRMQRCTINSQQLFEEQTALINKINKYVSKDAFNMFLPNYRDIATVYQIFSPGTKTKQRVLLEKQIVNQMLRESEKEGTLLRSINNLTLKTFIKTFNQKYEDDLIPEQKTLLNKYVSSFSDNGTELRVFLNEEITRLKECVEKSLRLNEIKNDPSMRNKTQRVLEILNTTSKRQVDGPFVQDILKIQNLVKEIN